MLVNSNEMLKNAKKGKYAIAQFNINNLEWTKYIIEECNKLNSDVILGVSEGAIKYIGGYNVVFSIVSGLIKDLNPKINICLHLDHATSVESCIKAIDAGFTSVMIDASKYELKENINITNQVISYAHKNNVSVEAEIGHIGGSEDNIESSIFNARLDECIELYNETKIDSLAPALGSVHGLYKEKPNLDFVTMKKISDSLNIPLVLHGGTGILENDIKKAIQSGICKININTELQVAWHNAVKTFIKENDTVYDPRKVISSGEKAIKEKIKEKLELFTSSNQK